MPLFGNLGTTEAIDASTKSFEQFNEAIAGTNAGMVRTRAGVNRTGKAFATFSNLLNPVTVGLLAIGYALTDSIKKFAEFEKNIVNAGTVTGQFGKSLNKAKTAMVETSKELGHGMFTAIEVSAAFYQLNSAGLSIVESTRMMSDVLNFATATLSETEQSAEVLTSTMRAFNMTAEQAGKISDEFAFAIGQSPLNISRLEESMKYAAPVASAMGRGLHEVTAALGTMAKRGFYGSIAGTSLRNVFVRLTRRTSDVSNALERLGLTYADVNPATHTLSEIIETLESKSAGLADIMEIMGVRAGPAFLSLMAEGADSLRQFGQEIYTANGHAERMAREQLQTLSGTFKKLKADITLTSIAIGDKLVGAFRSFGPVIVTTMASLAMFGTVLLPMTLASAKQGIPILTYLAVQMKRIGSAAVVAAQNFFGLFRMSVASTGAANRLSIAMSSLSAKITGVKLSSISASLSINSLKMAIIGLGTAIKSVGGLLLLITGALTVIGLVWMDNQKKLQKLKDEYEETRIELGEYIGTLTQVQTLEQRMASRDEMLEMLKERRAQYAKLQKESKVKIFSKEEKIEMEAIKKEMEDIAKAASDIGFHLVKTADGLDLVAKKADEVKWATTEFQTTIESANEAISGIVSNMDALLDAGISDELVSDLLMKKLENMDQYYSDLLEKGGLSGARASAAWEEFGDIIVESKGLMDSLGVKMESQLNDVFKPLFRAMEYITVAPLEEQIKLMPELQASYRKLIDKIVEKQGEEIKQGVYFYRIYQNEKALAEERGRSIEKSYSEKQKDWLKKHPEAFTTEQMIDILPDWMGKLIEIGQETPEPIVPEPRTTTVEEYIRSGGKIEESGIGFIPVEPSKPPSETYVPGGGGGFITPYQLKKHTGIPSTTSKTINELDESSQIITGWTAGIEAGRAGAWTTGTAMPSAYGVEIPSLTNIITINNEGGELTEESKTEITESVAKGITDAFESTYGGGGHFMEWSGD
jgi:TP901 family phage tail tape measure protein